MYTARGHELRFFSSLRGREAPEAISFYCLRIASPLELALSETKGRLAMTGRAKTQFVPARSIDDLRPHVPKVICMSQNAVYM
jgi:hypothetical protein